MQFISPYLVPFTANAALIVWAWLGFNQGKGLLFFTTDEVGLMFVLPLLVFANLLLWTVTLCLNKKDWAKGFGIIFLLSLCGSIVVWVHGYLNGVSS